LRLTLKPDALTRDRKTQHTQEVGVSLVAFAW
jgi:hypothetical protein